MAARKLGPAFAVLGAIMTLGVMAAPASAFSVGQTCNGTFNGGGNTNVICTGQGSPSQNVWVTVTNTGSVMWAPVACTQVAGSWGCVGLTGDIYVGQNFPYYAVAPGDSSFVSLPAGSTLGLQIIADNANTPAAGPVAAQITGIYPQSNPPPLAVGQVCNGANYIPLQVECIWTGQLGAVTQNSWVTFANTGGQTVTMSFNGLHGSHDNQQLQPGQLAYVGIGAGHSTSGTQLDLLEPGNPAPTEANLEVPPNPPAAVTIQSLVPENYSGFSLTNGQSCTTANYVENPVQCAPSGQIGQGSSSSDETVTLTNTSSNFTALVGNDNGGGGLLTLGPGQSGTTSFDKNAQLLLTCLTGSGNSNCGAGADATVKIVGLTGASNAATLDSPTVRSGGRLAARLHCLASTRHRCQGTITLRAERGGQLLGTATFGLRPRGSGTFQLLRGAKLPGAGLLTITTRQPNGRDLVTDRRTVALPSAGAVRKPAVFFHAGCSHWRVPAGVTSVRVLAVGAAGYDAPHDGAPGGSGDAVNARLGGLKPGRVLDVCVDMGGGGGGVGSIPGGGGGGASGVSLHVNFRAPLLVAGGGGGGGYSQYPVAGGNAGLPTGSVGGAAGGGGGGGGSDSTMSGGAGGMVSGGTAGTAGAGVTSTGPGAGGRGGDGGAGGSGGGGGAGGYFGGGGGVGEPVANSGSGGGGSDFCTNTATVSGCHIDSGAGNLTGAGRHLGQAHVVIYY